MSPEFVTVMFSGVGVVIAAMGGVLIKLWSVMQRTDKGALEGELLKALAKESRLQTETLAALKNGFDIHAAVLERVLKRLEADITELRQMRAG